MLFKQCPWEALEEIARWMRRRKFDDEAGYIERWIETLQPRGGTVPDGDDGIGLDVVPHVPVGDFGND